MTAKEHSIDLTIVALSFLIYGVWSVIRFLGGSFMSGVGIFGIPIYFGLMNYNNLWRLFALIFAWTTLLLTPMITFFLLFHRVFEKLLDVEAYNLGFFQTLLHTLANILIFAIAFLQYKVLTSKNVKPLFTGEPPV